MHRFLTLFGNFIGEYLIVLNVRDKEKLIIEDRGLYIQIFKMEVTPIIDAYEVNVSKGSEYLGSLFIDCLYKIKVNKEEKQENKKYVRENFIMSQLSEATQLKWRMRKFNSKLIPVIKEVESLILDKHYSILKIGNNFDKLDEKINIISKD